VLILSFTDAYRHLRVLLYDHSGGVGGSGNAVAASSDWDFFVLGALSKLGVLSEI
jgi:hypothetical protein